MKKHSLFLIALMLFGLSLLAQDDEGQEVKLYKMLRKKYLGMKGWIYLKGGKICGNGLCNSPVRKTPEFTLIVYKGNIYQIEIASPEKNKGVIASIYDARREKLGTTFINNKFHNKLIFKVQATGIYYVRFDFKDSNTWRGAYVVSLKNKLGKK